MGMCGCVCGCVWVCVGEWVSGYMCGYLPLVKTVKLIGLNFVCIFLYLTHARMHTTHTPQEGLMMDDDDEDIPPEQQPSS